MEVKEGHSLLIHLSAFKTLISQPEAFRIFRVFRGSRHHTFRAFRVFRGYENTPLKQDNAPRAAPPMRT